MRTQRLIFLDFDGVLHPTSIELGPLFCRAGLLIEVLEGTDCQIVISSSWRHHDDLAELLTRLPAALAGRVVGTTGAAHVGRWARHHEILQYLRDRALHTDWRALDDSVMEFPPGCPELIACDPSVGLGPGQCSRIRQWLSPD